MNRIDIRRESEDRIERITIICRRGNLTDELLSRINSHHEEERRKYKWGRADYELFRLLEKKYHLPADWEIAIISHSSERHNRMAGGALARWWEIPVVPSYYWTDVAEKLVYGGPII